MDIYKWILWLVAITAFGGGALYLTFLEETPPEVDGVNGQYVYFEHCAICHGPDGAGVELLGVPLVNSPFMHSLSDEKLRTFIMKGRLADSPESIMDEPMLPVDYLAEAEYAALISFLRRLSSH